MEQPFTWISDAVALLALIVSLWASRKAGRAQDRANEIARQMLDHTIEEDSALNTPILSFGVQVHLNAPFQCAVEITINNGGQYPTVITEGEILLKSHKYPEAEKPYPLAGTKIAGRGEHIENISFKRSLIYDLGPGIAPTELVCRAIYTRLGKDKGEAEEEYVFNQDRRRFVRKLH